MDEPLDERLDYSISTNDGKQILRDILSSLDFNHNNAFSQDNLGLAKALGISREELNVMRFEGKVSGEDSALTYFFPWLAFSYEPLKREPKIVTAEKMIGEAIRFNHSPMLQLIEKTRLKLDSPIDHPRTYEEAVKYYKQKKSEKYSDAESLWKTASSLRLQGETEKDAFIRVYSERMNKAIINSLETAIASPDTHFELEGTESFTPSRRYSRVYKLTVYSEHLRKSFYLKPYSELERRSCLLPGAKNLRQGNTTVSLPYFLAKTELGFNGESPLDFSVFADGSDDLEKVMKQFEGRESEKRGRYGLIGMALTNLLMFATGVGYGLVTGDDYMTSLYKSALGTVFVAGPVILIGAYSLLSYLGKQRRDFLESIASSIDGAGKEISRQIMDKIDMKALGIPLEDYTSPEGVINMLIDASSDEPILRQVHSELSGNYSIIAELLSCNEKFEPVPYLDSKAENIVLSKTATHERHLLKIDNDLSYKMQHPILDLAKMIERPRNYVFFMDRFKDALANTGIAAEPRDAIYKAAMEAEYGTLGRSRLRETLLDERIYSGKTEAGAIAKFATDNGLQNEEAGTIYHAAAVHISLLNIGKTARVYSMHPNVRNMQLYSACDALYHLHELSIMPEYSDDTSMQTLFTTLKGITESIYKSRSKFDKMIEPFRTEVAR